MFGTHAIKHLSSTQTLISLSSGEAQYYGCVRAASRGLGVKSMLVDLGVKGKRLRVKTDASVAKGLVARRGLGCIRHIEVNQLWLQEKVNNVTVEVEKVKGETNRADQVQARRGLKTTTYLDWPSNNLLATRYRTEAEHL